MKFLDNDPDVITWMYEPFAIPYVSNERTKRIRMYHPDFLIKRKSSGLMLEEIKPLNKVNKRINKKKALAANKWCAKRNLKYQIITETELNHLNLL